MMPQIQTRPLAYIHLKGMSLIKKIHAILNRSPEHWSPYFLILHNTVSGMKLNKQCIIISQSIDWE